MNDARRKLVGKAFQALERAYELLDEAHGEEQDAYESIAERFPGSEQEASLSESSSALEQAAEDVRDVMGAIEGYVA